MTEMQTRKAVQMRFTTSLLYRNLEVFNPAVLSHKRSQRGRRECTKI